MKFFHGNNIRLDFRNISLSLVLRVDSIVNRKLLQPLDFDDDRVMAGTNSDTNGLRMDSISSSSPGITELTWAIYTTPPVLKFVKFATPVSIDLSLIQRNQWLPRHRIRDTTGKVVKLSQSMGHKS